MSSRLHHIQNWPELARSANWSVAVLATNCRVSVRTLERHFLTNFEKSPHSWLSENRRCLGDKMLQAGCTVKEVAGSLSYKHATHFSREFKTHTGHSPTARLTQ
jgi:transcriptional regulator GlxA family with amidase domain